MEYIVGVVLALCVSLFATIVGLDRDRAFYPTVMIVIASYYAVFALIGGSGSALTLESMAGTGFLVAAVLGFRANLWWTVAALAVHGAFDFVHGHLIFDPGVPPWWPGFCLTYDIVAAGYLAWLIHARRVSATPLRSEGP